MTFLDVISKIPGLTHYYELTKDANDSVGSVHGKNHGCTFGSKGAVFDGDSYIELSDHNDFSVATKGGLTVLVFMTLDSWKGAHASEYVNWMGKAANGTPAEWCFRHYVWPNGSGEAATRPKRTSFYHFNISGGLGAGSFFQDDDPTGQERVVVGTCDLKQTQIFKNGVKRDTDLLSGYSIKPQNTAQPVRLGSKDLATGFLVGKLRRVAFWNRVLTDTEIKSIYAARNEADSGASTPPPTTTTPPPTPKPEPTPTPTPDPSGAFVRVGSTAHAIDAMDAKRGVNQLVYFTTKTGQSTGANEFGAEATVVNGKVTSLADGVGDAAIPAGGYVLSGHGDARTWLISYAKVGAVVTLSGVTPSTPEAPAADNPYIATSGDLLEKHNKLAADLRAKGVV
jgi:hypothetical protein